VVTGNTVIPIPFLATAGSDRGSGVVSRERNDAQRVREQKEGKKGKPGGVWALA